MCPCISLHIHHVLHRSSYVRQLYRSVTRYVQVLFTVYVERRQVSLLTLPVSPANYNFINALYWSVTTIIRG